MKKNIIIMLLLLAAVLPTFALTKEMILLNESSAGLVLEDGKGYYFNSRELTLRAPATIDALTVAPGATAYIYVNSGQTLRLYGGDANLSVPAGAGILVEKGSRLCIVGNGIVEAYGGNSGMGTIGENGQSGQFQSSNNFSGGYGGAGGNGGGGAAAGIGGRGGHGGKGTPRVLGKGWREVYPHTELYNGTTGNTAEYGGDGGNMGEVYVIGNSTVKAYPGKDNNSVIDKVATSGITQVHNFNSFFGNDYYAGGGGAGGNGASGYSAPWGIGGGAAGASGAGAGASGAIFDIYSFAPIQVLRYSSKYKDAKSTGNRVAENTERMIEQKEYEKQPAVSEYHRLETENININGSTGLGAYNHLNGMRYPDNNFNSVDFKEFKRVLLPFFFPSVHVVETCPGSSCGDPGYEGTQGRVYTFMHPTFHNLDSLGNNMPEDHEMYSKLNNIPDFIRPGVSTVIVFSKDSVARGGDFGDDGTNILNICIGDKMPVLNINPDTTPLHVLDADKPEAPLYAFGGYADKSGKRWYDENGTPINNVEGVFDEVQPVELFPVWNNNFYCVVVHEKQALDNETEYVPFEYDLKHASYVLKENPGVQLENIVFNIKALDPSSDKYATELKGFVPTVNDVTVVYTKDQYSDKQQHVVTMHYDRVKGIVHWNLPPGTTIMDSDNPISSYYHPYTKEGSMLKYGERIVAPMYVAVVNADAYGAYTIDHWTRNDGAGEAALLTMPEHDVVLTPVLAEADINVYAQSSCGDIYIGDTKVESLQPAMAKANTNQIITIKPYEGWEVDKTKGIMLTHHYHDAAGQPFTTSHAVYEIEGMPNTFVVPVRGEAMDLDVAYVAKKVTMTLTQPMNDNVRVARTWVRSSLTAKPVEMLYGKENFPVGANTNVRILVEAESADECLDSVSVKIMTADGTRIPFRIVFESDTIGASKDIVARGGIEFTAPVSDFTVTYGLRTVDTNTLVINTHAGLGASLGLLTDTEMQQVITGKDGNTTYTNDAIYGNSVIYVEFTEDANAYIYKVGKDGNPEEFDGYIASFKRDGNKDGYAIYIPADARGQEYVVSASYAHPVAYLFSEKEGGKEEHMVLYRHNNDITLNGNWRWNHFMVGDECVAEPFRKADPEAKLHINLTYETRDMGYTPFVVPFSFILDKETNDKCGFAVPSEIEENEQGKISVIYLTKLEVGDVVHANYGYYMNPRQAGPLSLELYTDRWEQTTPHVVEYKTKDGEQFIQHVPTYDYVLVNTLYKEQVTPIVIGKGKAQYVTDTTPSYFMNPLGAYFLTNGNPRQMDVKVLNKLNDDEEDIPFVVDGIAEINADRKMARGIYDIMGRKMPDGTSALKPGLYIINGKKVIVK